jgi:hypothetical protein
MQSMQNNKIGIHPNGGNFPKIREAIERRNAHENPVRKRGYASPPGAQPLEFDEDRDYEVSSEYFKPPPAFEEDRDYEVSSKYFKPQEREPYKYKPTLTDKFFGKLKDAAGSNKFTRWATDYHGLDSSTIADEGWFGNPFSGNLPDSIAENIAEAFPHPASFLMNVDDVAGADSAVGALTETAAAVSPLLKIPQQYKKARNAVTAFGVGETFSDIYQDTGAGSDRAEGQSAGFWPHEVYDDEAKRRGRR